jgi:HD-GYP domain-containing protein (c-di-GMP phosphodiesterase class II)
MEELVRQLEPEGHAALRKFMHDLSGYEHGVSCAMIAGVLARAFGIETPRLVENVGIAALLHDLALSSYSEEVRSEDESRMTEQQRASSREHPAAGAEALAAVPGVDPGAVQAIAQHHQRLNKMGFPQRHGVGSVNRVAEIVGIADEFSRLIARAARDPAVNPLREMNLAVFPGFSRPVQATFRRAFLVED